MTIPAFGTGDLPEEPAPRPASIDFTIVQVPVGVTLPLRQAVLGVHGSSDPLVLPGDDDPTTIALAAVDPRGELLSTIRVSREPPPFPTRELRVPARRLRGMATREDRRNQGIGSAVLRAAMACVASQGGDLIWCNARTPALGLYLRAGFATYGQEWLEGPFGPHIVAWTRVAEQ